MIIPFLVLISTHNFIYKKETTLTGNGVWCQFDKSIRDTQYKRFAARAMFFVSNKGVIYTLKMKYLPMTK